MEETNLKKRFYNAPTLTEYGTLREILENHYRSTTRSFWSWEPLERLTPEVTIARGSNGKVARRSELV
jgi:hypothetical protein